MAGAGEVDVSHSRRWIPLTAGACLLAATLVAGLVLSARAEESNADQAPRYLGGHLFISSLLVPDPFVSTTFTSKTGGGSAVNLNVPIYNLKGDKIAETSAEIGFLQLGFGYQQAINHRVAVRADLGGAARTGTSAASILSEGISTIYGYGVGTTVNVMRRDAWLLSATADLRGNTLYGISPLDFVRSVVRSVASGDTAGAVSDAGDSLLAKGVNLRLLGGVRGAYAPSPWIGFTGFLEAGIGDRFKGSDNIGVTNFGMTASFDLDPLVRYPFGVLGSFRNESLSEKGDDVGDARTFGLGLFYTGRRYFSIGLEGNWSQISQPQTDKKIDVALAQILLRYDFK